MKAVFVFARRSLLGLCVVVPWHPPATTLVVSVADAKNGAPLEGALVRLPDVGRETRANWLGEARFVNLAEGPYKIQVRHLGYAASEITYAVKGDTAGAVFMLERIAAPLDTVKVAAVPVSVRMQDFETRRRMGIGHFLTDSMFKTEGDHELPYVLATRLPGLRTEGRIGALSIAGVGCSVDVYVDGFLRNPPPASARDVAGVELYNIGEAPAAYRRLGSACKVLLIWTKY